MRANGDRPGEEGLTLVELLVAMSILVIVLGSVYGLLFSVQNGFERQVDRSTSLDQARQALLQIDREMRSASAMTAATGTTLDAYTRTNQVSASGDAARTTQMCVQWRVVSGNLQTRMWPLVGAPATVTWRTIATNLVNTDVFEIPTRASLGRPGDGRDPKNLYNGRLLNVHILANSAPATGTNAAPSVELRSSLSGRNVNGQPDPCFAKISASPPTSPQPN